MRDLSGSPENGLRDAFQSRALIDGKGDSGLFEVSIHVPRKIGSAGEEEQDPRMFERPAQ
jgi:hypothetical protein